MQPSDGDAIVVTRTYLELRELAELRRVPAPDEPAELVRVEQPSPETYRALYTLVGGPWHWRDRNLWSDRQLADYLASPDVHIHELTVAGARAGFFELRRDDHTVEIMYFGLATAFMGRGLGGWMLTRAVDEAEALGASRVILNTCTLDAPAALPNYLARGFRVIRQELVESSPESSRATTPAP